MGELKLRRKRYIPEETILLKDDILVEANDEVIITTWKTLNPKSAFSHGCSCYFLKEGVKVSKFYRFDNSLLYWYCDIVEYEWNEDRTELTVSDLLADVIVYPDGHWKVVDLDELADAMESNLITPAQATKALRQLHELLSLLYRNKFDKMQNLLDKRGL